MDNERLLKHFEYWDERVDFWLTGKADCAEEFLPEPWWGWTPESAKLLNSVVINLCPGAGGKPQERDALMKFLTQNKYSVCMRQDFQNNLNATNDWHKNKRARPILEGRIDDKDYLTHHLSIEICPFHSTDAKNLECYVAKNYNEVVGHSILFAADAARCCEGALKNIVLVRCSPCRFCNMFKSLGVKCSCCQKERPRSPHWLSFKDDRLKEISFVCFSGVRNKFKKEEIAEIYEKISKIPNKNN